MFAHIYRISLLLAEDCFQASKLNEKMMQISSASLHLFSYYNISFQSVALRGSISSHLFPNNQRLA